LFKRVFTYLADNANVNYKDFERFINSLGFSKKSQEVIENLIDYSLIIFRDSSGKLYFNYREKSELDKIGTQNLYLTLPKCIYHYYKKIQ